VTVEWRPYELHPEIPRDGVPRDRVLPPAYRARVEEGVRQLGAQAGLRLRRHDRLINSRTALQAAEFARSVGRFEPMHRELFRVYWEVGSDVSDLRILREIADRAGIDQDAMAAAVEADRYGALLDRHRQDAEDLLISGIPAHVIEDRYLVLGAQPYDVFQRVFQKLNTPARSTQE